MSISESERWRQLEKLIAEESLDLEPALSKALSDRSVRIRAVAAETIGKKQFKKLLPNLFGAVNDSSALVRFDAIESIRILSPGKEAATRLVGSLKDKDELVRVAAAQALGEIKNKEVLGELEISLSDGDPLVRAYAAGAIGEIGTVRGKKILKEHISKESNDRALVDYFYALFSFGESEYLDKLLGLISSNDLLTRCAAADALSVLPLDESERKRILALLKKQKRKEDTVLSRECFDEAIGRIMSVA